MGVNATNRLPPIGPRDWPPATRGLLLAIATASVVLRVLPSDLAVALAVPDLAKPWSMFTANFFEFDLTRFFITSVMLMWFGTAMERLMGTQRFLRFFLGLGTLGYLASSVYTKAVLGSAQWISAPLGPAYGFAGLLVAFGVFHRNATVLFMFLFPVNAWNLIWYGLGFDLLLLIWTGRPHYFGMLVAGLAAYAWLTRGRGDSPLDTLRTKAEAAFKKWDHKRKTSHLKVLKGGKGDAFVRDDDDPPPGGKPRIIH